nr:truncated Nla_18150 protein [Neisseria lactamica]
MKNKTRSCVPAFLRS